jgi:hypothetical protein
MFNWLLNDPDGCLLQVADICLRVAGFSPLFLLEESSTYDWRRIAE